MTKRIGIIGLTIASSVFMAGCEQQLEQAIVSAQESITTAMNTHEYRTVRFDWLMTETDRNGLVQPVVTPLPPVDLVNADVPGTLDELRGMLDQTEALLSDYDFYLSTLDKPDVLNSAFSSIYTSPSSATFFASLMEDAYSARHTYGDAIDIIGFGQHKEDGKSMWVVNTEWKVLQDSRHYKVYPITFTLTDALAFVDAKVGPVSDREVYTRPLTEDSLITDGAHEPFRESWARFSQQFSNRDTSNNVANKDHLSSVSRDGIGLDVLLALYDATDGDLSNGSITQWHMHDKEAEALSTYRYDVPHADGTVFSVVITYSRLYDDIQTIEQMTN